jgi:hypothetical protein
MHRVFDTRLLFPVCDTVGVGVYVGVNCMFCAVFSCAG